MGQSGRLNAATFFLEKEPGSKEAYKGYIFGAQFFVKGLSRRKKGLISGYGKEGVVLSLKLRVHESLDISLERNFCIMAAC